MKKIFIFYTLILSLDIMAQDAPYDTLVNSVRDFYDNLDHTTMQTDYLFNRGFIIMNSLEDWKDGNPVITNLEKWKYIYSSIQESDKNNHIKFPFIDTLIIENNIELYSSSTIALAILNYKGDYLTNDNVQQIIETNAQENFIQFNVFAGTVLHHKVYNKTVYFKWLPNFYFTNLSENFILQIDFTDGNGYQTINTSNPQTYSVTYDCIGEKNIMFKCITSKDTLISYSKIIISSLEPVIPTSTGEIIIGDTIDTPLKSDPEINIARANYNYYEGNDGELDKPVIITEGFDIAGTQTANDLYEYWRTRIERLRNRGYDVFVLNFRSPGRSLQKNSDIVIDLIKGINEAKFHNYEGIYIGESMGGVLGRIALKRMEEEGYDHQIGLLVPYDSPMKGANVPKGLQWLFHDAYWLLGPTLISGTVFVELLEFITTADVPALDLYQQLNSTGARQLIARHYDGSADYNEFQNYLDILGYPFECRKVAFINGSDNQTLQTGVTLGNSITSIEILIGIFYINAEAWYSKVNIIDQKVSNLVYFNPISPLPIPIKLTREESFDNKPFDNCPAGNVDYVVSGSNVNVAFAPTVSTIDISRSIFDSGDFLYFNNIPSGNNKAFLVNNDHTPFDDIYSDGVNNSHTSNENSYFTFENQELMYDSLFLQNRTITKDIDFDAVLKITAGNDVQSSVFPDKLINTGDLIVESGNRVHITAPMVILEPGTQLMQGSYVNVNTSISHHHKSSSISKAPTLKIVGNKYICGESCFRANISSETASIEWRLVGENINISESFNEFIPPKNLKSGQYTLYCTSMSDQGTSTISKVVVVSSDEKCQLLKQFKKKVEQNETMNLSSVYPNPTTGKFVVKFTESKDFKAFLTVIDATGKRIIKNKIVNDSFFDIDISGFPNGLYFIEIQTDVKIETHKIIKY